MPQQDPSSRCFLTLCKNRCLSSYLPQLANNLLIAIHKPIQRVWNPDLDAKVLYQPLSRPQVMHWNTRKEMMDRLKLESAVHKVQPLGAIDIHGGTEHLLRKGLARAQVCRAHGEMAEGALNVKRCCGHMADQDEDKTSAGTGNTLVNEPVAKLGPEEELASEFEPAIASGGALSRTQAENQVDLALSVEIEVAEEEDWIVKILLVLDDGLRKGVVSHNLIVIGAPQRVEEAVGNREEGHMLDIWIVLGRVGHNVMYIVPALPPTLTEASEKVSKENSNGGIDVVVVRDAHMASIMAGQGKLMPKKAEEEPARSIPSNVKE